MKKVIFTAVIAISTCLSAASQTANWDNQKAETDFKANFDDVSNVQWVSNDDFIKAYFLQDGRSFAAFYSPDGDFIGTTSRVAVNDLPLFVQTALEDTYGNYTVQNAFKFISDDSNSYFISVENDVYDIVLKAEDWNVSVYSKSKRKK